MLITKLAGGYASTLRPQPPAAERYRDQAITVVVGVERVIVGSARRGVAELGETVACKYEKASKASASNVLGAARVRCDPSHPPQSLRDLIYLHATA